MGGDGERAGGKVTVIVGIGCHAALLWWGEAQVAAWQGKAALRWWGEAQVTVAAWQKPSARRQADGA